MENYSASQIRSVMFTLYLAIFLGALDQTVVAVAMPSMVQELGDLSLLSWVVSGYLMSAAVVTPIYGKLSDFYGRRVMLSIALTIFLLASIACACSQSMLMLIVFRILQGCGGGGLISLAQATIAEIIPLRERGKYQGYISGAYALASVAGPVVGGALTEFFSWRWIFWINLPLTLLALGLAYQSLKIIPVQHRRTKIDFAGIFALIITLISFLMAATLLGKAGNLSPLIFSLFCLSLLGLWLFIRIERIAIEPVMPLALFKIKECSVGMTVLFINFMQVVCVSVFVPLQIQAHTIATSSEAALRLLPLTLSVPMGAFIAGRLISKTGRYRPQQLNGAVIAGVCIFLYAWTPINQAILGMTLLFISGLGMGAQFPTTLVGIQHAVPKEHLGVATATTALFRTLGATVGIAILSCIYLRLLPEASSLASSRSANVDSSFTIIFILIALPSIATYFLLRRLDNPTLHTH
jgi:EmrB/QacA subfamily drug resistance transporter